MPDRVVGAMLAGGDGVNGGASGAACLRVFICRSSCELFEFVELTGDTEAVSLLVELSKGMRLADALLDDLLARPESTLTRVTSLPFNDAVAASRGVKTTSPP